MADRKPDKKAILSGVLLTAALLTALLGSLIPEGPAPLQISGSSVVADEFILPEPELPHGEISVNIAPEEVLEKLPGIGPKLAALIVEEREQNGYFYYPEDLRAVKGIGQGKVRGIRELINMDIAEGEE